MDTRRVIFEHHAKLTVFGSIRYSRSCFRQDPLSKSKSNLNQPRTSREYEYVCSIWFGKAFLQIRVLVSDFEDHISVTLYTSQLWQRDLDDRFWPFELQHGRLCKYPGKTSGRCSSPKEADRLPMASCRAWFYVSDAHNSSVTISLYGQWQTS